MEPRNGLLLVDMCVWISISHTEQFSLPLLFAIFKRHFNR